MADGMWYFPLLEPWVDHVPVKADLSDLEEKIRLVSRCVFCFLVHQVPRSCLGTYFVPSNHLTFQLNPFRTAKMAPTLIPSVFPPKSRAQ